MATLLILLILFLIISSAFFSASESALFSLSTMKIKTYQTSHNPRYNLIAKLVTHPRDLLVTVFMANTLVNILLQNATSSFFGAFAGWSLKVGVPLFLTLVFGEIIPKYIGLVNNAGLAYRIAPTIDLLQTLLTPIRRAIIAITAPLSRIMFFFLRKEETISKEELQHVLQTSKEHGVLHDDEVELINGYLTLQESQVKELMQQREDILYYDLNEPISKLIYLIVDQECTRVPVCDKNIDKLIGIIAADQFFLHRSELNTPQMLVPLLSKPFFIPETTSGRLLQRRFDELNEEMAIVVDEYGSISGLITYEDLIETVIGEIADLRDQNQRYTRSGDNVIIASGKLELDEFREVFGVELKSPNNMNTIGGWLTEQLGDIPKTGMKYESEGFLFHVLASEPNRVTRVYIRKLRKESP
jgi:putative hemolysin